MSRPISCPIPSASRTRSPAPGLISKTRFAPQMLAGKRVLIAAHGNSLRSLVMKLEHLTPEEILKVNIPTGVPLVYTFDTDFNVLDKRYIGDPATIAAKIDAVANQGKAHK